ncbi:MAG: hypothetical protein MK291_06525 [Planctomycetes bacterium]|nr:hypothetical protein [Planctomycetota bacterium]
MCTRSLLLFTAALSMSGLSAAAEGADEVSFQSEVLPLLSRSCFPCHGPDAATREAGLRFDDRDDAVLDRDGYRAS